MSISLINQSYLQSKKINFQNEIETNDGYIVFKNQTDKKFCLVDRVNGVCIDLSNENGYISVMKYKDNDIIIARTYTSLIMYKLNKIYKKYIFKLESGYWSFSYSLKNDYLQIVLSEEI